jgi:hypothetical protein
MQDALNNVFPMLFGLIVLVTAVVILGMAMRWCINDARRRGKSPTLVCIAVVFFFPWGLAAWLLFRPEPMDDGRGRPHFRLDNHRLQ